MIDLVMNLTDFLVAHGFIKFLEGKKGEKIKGQKEEKEEFARWKCCFLFPPSLTKPEKMGSWRSGGGGGEGGTGELFHFPTSRLPKKRGVDNLGDLEDTHI